MEKMGGIMVPLILLPLVLVNFNHQLLCTRFSKHLATSSSLSPLFVAASSSLNSLIILHRTCTKILLHVKPYEVTFSISGHWSQTDSGWRSYDRFTPALHSVLRHFRTRSVERFYHNSSHRSPKLVFKINWHGGIPYLSSFALGSGDSIADAGPLTKISTYH